MKHILYLPSWFPGRRNPYPGDFIKRHAESASLYNRITVFHTAIDETIKEPIGKRRRLEVGRHLFRIRIEECGEGLDGKQIDEHDEKQYQQH